jgi:hypothetical protein
MRIFGRDIINSSNFATQRLVEKMVKKLVLFYQLIQTKPTSFQNLWAFDLKILAISIKTI